MAKKKEVKTDTAKSEPAENLSAATDALGDTRARKKILEIKEKELSDYLKLHVKPGITIHGKFYTCDIVASMTRVIDVLKAFKKLGKDKFLKIASIAIKEASKVMSDEEIDALSDTKPGSVSARTNPIPQARGIEAPVLGGQENIEL